MGRVSANHFATKSYSCTRKPLQFQSRQSCRNGSCSLPEVLCCFGYNICEQLDFHAADLLRRRGPGESSKCPLTHTHLPLDPGHSHKSCLLIHPHPCRPLLTQPCFTPLRALPDGPCDPTAPPSVSWHRPSQRFQLRPRKPHDEPPAPPVPSYLHNTPTPPIIPAVPPRGRPLPVLGTPTCPPMVTSKKTTGLLGFAASADIATATAGSGNGGGSGNGDGRRDGAGRDVGVKVSGMSGRCVRCPDCVWAIRVASGAPSCRGSSGSPEQSTARLGRPARSSPCPPGHTPAEHEPTCAQTGKEASGTWAVPATEWPVGPGQ